VSICFERGIDIAVMSALPRHVGLAGRGSLRRNRAVDVLRQSMLDCHLAGTAAPS
jgi:hypothetical protein